VVDCVVRECVKRFSCSKKSCLRFLNHARKSPAKVIQNEITTLPSDNNNGGLQNFACYWRSR